MSGTMKKKIQIVCVLFCAVLTILNNARAKPTLAFTLPPSLTSIPSLSSYTHQFVGRKLADQMKNYSGNRFSNESLIMIYFSDQTIAVVELGPAKLLLNCELIEIYDDKEGMKLLQKLSTINKPLEITFKDMVKLMNQCDIVEKQNEINRQPHLSKEQRSVDGGGTGLFPQNPFSLLSGIVPGTKWCGTGDIATSYSDLGFEKTMDRCCRQHDLCPVKIRAYQNRYNLINNSLYSKSHCTCDDMLFSCLKKTNTSAAQVMGSIYFNLVQLVTFVHFFLLANAMLGTFLPQSYLFYNILFLVSLFWTMHCKESVDAIHTAALIDACSIILDLICIIAYFNSFHNAWSIIFAIVNVIARPFSLILLHREMVDRGGSINVSTVYPTTTQRSYEDIDHPKQSVPTNSAAGGAGQPTNISNIF